MGLRLRKVLSYSEISNAALRQWAEPRSRASYTRIFVATVDNKDIAYVAVDVVPIRDYVELYQLYVLPEQRRRGYGTTILRKVEQMATELGLKKIVLNPQPIDGESTREDLIRWYLRNGYSWLSEDKDFMLKRVSTAEEPG
jgi:GNAT superfamily N-acetyltransferase